MRYLRDVLKLRFPELRARAAAAAAAAAEREVPPLGFHLSQDTCPLWH